MMIAEWRMFDVILYVNNLQIHKFRHIAVVCFFLCHFSSVYLFVFALVLFCFFIFFILKFGDNSVFGNYASKIHYLKIAISIILQQAVLCNVFSLTKNALASDFV